MTTCYRIPSKNKAAFAAKIQTVVSISEARKCITYQPDGSIFYYADTEAERQVCRNNGGKNVVV